MALFGGDQKAIGAGKIRELYDRGTKDLAAAQRQWWINVSFVQNEQWIYWNNQLNRPDRIQLDPERLYFTNNRLRPASATVIAKLLRRPLVFEVPPQAADDASVQGARIAASVLTDIHRDQNWESLREDLAWSVWQGGTGLLCLEWDAAAGVSLGRTESGRHVGTGNVVAQALTICEVATEPGARDIERARWWIRARALPPADVKEMYGLKEKPQADASAGMSPLQHKLLSDAGQPSSLCRVLTYFERPSKDSAGQVVTVVGNSVVDGPHPWPFPFTDRLNLVAMRGVRVNGRWTGDTVLSDAISIQTALNHAESALGEHMRHASNARMWVPEVSMDVADALTDQPGEIVLYKTMPGYPEPDWKSPPGLPGWMVERPAALKADIDDVLAVHDVSRGDAPPDVHSGVALNILAENDDTPLGKLAKETAEGFGRFATLVLRTLEAKVTETRHARVDLGRLPESVPWNGKSFAGQTTATVPQDAVAPRSRAASFQLATQAKQMFPDQVDLKTFAAIADLPGADDLTERVDPDVAKAQRSMHLMALGIPVVPDKWDDHAVAIAEANRFRKSVRYEQLDQQSQGFIETYVQGHETMAAQEAGQQVARAQVNPNLALAAQGAQPAPLGAPPQVPVPIEPAMAPDQGAPDVQA